MIILKHKKFHILITTFMLCLPVFNYSMYDTDMRLKRAINFANIKKAKKFIKIVDLNRKSKIDLCWLFLDLAMRAVSCRAPNNGAVSEAGLEILELLLQNGVSANLGGGWYPSALNKMVSTDNPQLKIIDLLLKYGADIGEDIKQEAREKRNSNEIFELFSHHENLREKARTSPTDNLLTWAIGYNYPHIVKLIVNSKPELVNNLNLCVSHVTSPGSVKILKEALLMKKLNIFKQCAEERNMPSELIAYTAKIVNYNKHNEID